MSGELMRWTGASGAHSRIKSGRQSRRELDVRPGDALRCRVDFETSYGPDHEVLAERYRIVEILEVLPASRSDGELATPRPDRARARQGAEELETAGS